jgi:uncharacterized protein
VGAPPADVAVAVLAKAPVAGRVKTRLCPPLRPAEAARLAAAMVADAVAAARSSGADVWLAHAGGPHPWADVMDPVPPLLAQRGAAFGERMAAVQGDLFAAGYGAVVLLAADAPSVDAAHLRAAVAGLGDADVVLGPARDGGYVLVASRRPTPALFRTVVMGGGDVLARTLQVAADEGLRPALLQARHDVDVASDLRAAERDGALAGAPRTRAAAAALGLLHAPAAR